MLRATLAAGCAFLGARCDATGPGGTGGIPECAIERVTVSPRADTIATGRAIAVSVRLSPLQYGCTLDLRMTSSDSAVAAAGRTLQADSVTIVAVAGRAPGSAVVRFASRAVRDSVAVAVRPAGPYLAVGAGGWICALSEAGAPYCLWFSASGEPLRAGRSDGFDRVSDGGNTECFLTPAGAAYCLGGNDHGELGAGASAPQDSREPLPVSGGITFRDIDASGENFVCGLDTGGAAWCWGGNWSGQLGTGARGTAALATAPVPVSGGLSFSALAVGSDHACGVGVSGQVFCWGSDAASQLGGAPADSSCIDIYGTTHRCRPTPGATADRRAYVAVAAGDQHTCGLLADGSAWCWGSNQFGQLGTGDTVTSAVPRAVTGGLRFASLSAGVLHTCGVIADGTAYCWGSVASGRIGVPPGAPPCGLLDPACLRSKPVPVPGGQRFRYVRAGWEHSCGMTLGGRVLCWGGSGYLPKPLSGQP